MLFDFFLFNTVMVVYLVALTFVFYVRLPRPQTYSPPDGEEPLVSVVIPARNEEQNIARCLESFLKQDYPNIEIIVIDDRSSDSTGAIIEGLAKEHPSITPLKTSGGPPVGWTGKNNAIVQAAEHASGAYILFVDADTWHYPDSVRRGVSFARTKKTHLVSFWPFHEMASFGERLMTPALWVSFFWLDPFQIVNHFCFPVAYAVGHAILVDRQAYLAVGGHRSVHGEIVEDHALAIVMKRKGFQIQMADGSKILKVRMYTSLEEFWHGWSKNLFGVIRYRLDALCLVLIYILCGMVFPFLQLGIVVDKIASGMPTNHLLSLEALVGLQFAGLVAWHLRIANHFQKVSWAFFPLLPLSGLILCACYLNSTFLVLTGAEVSWKGRKYSASRLKLPGLD